MRIVSLVPSWTEMLIECGAEVVGRTRYCIHPKDQIGVVPAVGGTKAIDLQKLTSLKPDLVILDREENPKILSETLPCPFLATHIRSVTDVAGDIERIAQAIVEPSTLISNNLKLLAQRWRQVIERSSARTIIDWEQFPGVIEWLRKPESAGEPLAAPFVLEMSGRRVVYVIWRDPWMAVTSETFIGSVLGQAGVDSHLIWPAALDSKTVSAGSSSSSYPIFEAAQVPLDAILLFSSEPFPFHKKKHELLSQFPNSMAIVDGESFSWFGLRSLIFLEQHVLRQQGSV